MEHKARKRFGQNFLHDAGIIQEIVANLQLQSRDHCVEIGPGLGALTFAMLPYLQHLDVIEIDRDLVQVLQDANQANKLTIYSADVLKFDFNQLQAKPLRIVGNLPYNISTPLIFHLFDFIASIQDMHFMLQLEVVERMAAEPDTEHYGRLSVMVQYYCDVIPLLIVPASAFTPAPKVTSAVVRLVPKTAMQIERAHDEKLFSQLVRTAFNQRRKMLRNTLKGLATVEQLEAVGIDPHARAETIRVEQYVKLTNSL
ncbi:MAG: 16S rRNA (adenine(1518)-N(6)/adenine(1519)-N(6))-dimethyltransferase RsmA [Gammaproteobacteria bacterium]|nr:16S rRNA (adenine(1518)-N(6)/adenine(1519)-N(6))-dimethyltransferase RsmA [Gammaproteobacteria bacterium]